jgi:GNAT superfamily N-acetyltransferase
MSIQAIRAELNTIDEMRDLYRQEMNCQIIHDSLHSRKGWTESYELRVEGNHAGYGSIAVGGPWKGKPTVFEFYVLPNYRLQVFELFSELLSASGAVRIEVQSNDPMVTVMLHTFAENVTSESILFHDKIRTAHAPPGGVVRRVKPEDAAQIKLHELDESAAWVVEVGGEVAGAGDILFHYNRPYGDIYMKVGTPFRRRGIGSYLVQELKRICYEGGSVPAARCNPENIASRKTLQKAGFVPCGHILNGDLRSAASGGIDLV